MRLVALVALVFALTLPNFAGAVTGIDECANAGAMNCQKIAKPDGTPPGIMDKTYYIWLAGASCFPSFDASKCGRPVARVAGLLYEESNHSRGRQRLARAATPPAGTPALLRPARAPPPVRRPRRSRRPGRPTPLPA